MLSTLTLMRLYAKRRRVALSTLGRLMVGSSNFADRLDDGRVFVATIRKAEQWLSDHWPDDLDWPPDIPRPTPKRTDKAA